jgi:autotransporter-associated beta strand protein
MRKRTIQYSLCAAAGIAAASLTQTAYAAAPVLDGTLDSPIYGTSLATQTVNTGFGDSTAGDGSSSGGSELDAAYGTVQGTNLYLFLAGNFENNGNRVNVFIADGRSGGQNVLNASTASGTLSNANGMVFPAGFNATYVIDANVSGSTFYVDQYDLTRSAANYLGSVPLSGGIGANTNLGGIGVGVNNTNAAGVNGNTGTAADPNAADAVTTGLELAIPLAALGNPTGSVQVLADINNNNDTYLSNQFLGGLPVGYGNLGSPASANVAAATPFSITIPAAPNGNWLPTTGGSWANASNWSNNVIPNASGAAAVFVTSTTASTVTLDGSYTVGAITFNSTSPYTISSGTGGTLTLNNGTSAATITDSGGAHMISAPLVLASNTSVTVVNHGDSVTLSGNISGTGSLTTFDLGGGGTQFAQSLVVISGSNTYAGGTIINGGNLQLGSATALPAASALTLDAVDVPAGVLDLNNFNASVGSLTVTTGPNTAALGAVGRIINTSATAGTATLTYAGNNSNPSTFPGIISDNATGGGGTTALLVTSGSLTLTNTNSYAGATTVRGGTLTLGAAGALPAGTNLNIGSGATVVASNLGTANAVSVGTLSVAGQFDLTNNGLVVHSGTLASVTALLKSGYNAGKWNGSTGIISSVAAIDSTHLTTLGVISNDNGSGTPLYGSGGSIYATFNSASPVDGDVLVKYTYYGDANLDGAVDGSDYTLIDAGFGSHGSLTGWYNGDFNYDGKIDGSDYTLIDNAFNTQGASLGSNPATLIASTVVPVAGESSPVPEPASLGILTFSAIGSLGRRRRGRTS